MKQTTLFDIPEKTPKPARNRMGADECGWRDLPRHHVRAMVSDPEDYECADVVEGLLTYETDRVLREAITTGLRFLRLEDDECPASEKSGAGLAKESSDTLIGMRRWPTSPACEESVKFISRLTDADSARDGMSGIRATPGDSPACDLAQPVGRAIFGGV